MTGRAERAAHALIGAYVADAAAVGLHWLYDAEKVAALTEGGAAFAWPGAAAFEGVRYGFVHDGKAPGDLSHYGAQMRVMVRSLAATGGKFDLADYQDRFARTFGPGGDWVGYIDKATRGTLENLAAGRRAASGADDDQNPAVVKLPPLVACAGEGDFFATVDAAVAATSANDAALAWARPCAAALATALDGASVGDALRAGIESAAPKVAAALTAAMESKTDPTDFAGEVGRACSTPSAVPVVWRIAAAAPDYRSAVEANIRAAGDSCGRAPVLGALFAAAEGIGGAGVPADWVMRLREGPALAVEIAALAAHLEGAP